MRILGLAAIVAAGASCGDVIRTGRSPVMLVINVLQAAQGNRPSALSGTLTSDVITNVTSPSPCSVDTPCPTVFNDVGSVQFALAQKDTTVAPTSNNQVTIERYRVEYTRADGRNTPGVDVPYPFEGAVTGTVTPGGTLTLGFEIVRHVAKQDSPLVQLSSNPGIITTLTRVTFFGRDQVGNAISASGTITIDFGNFGDAQ